MEAVTILRETLTGAALILEVVCLAIILGLLRNVLRRRASAARTAALLTDSPIVAMHVSKLRDETNCATATALHKSVWVHYDDVDEHEAERLIVIHEIFGVMTPRGFEAQRIEAYCRTAHAPRTFYVARVAWTRDAETHEYIADFSKWLAVLAKV